MLTGLEQQDIGRPGADAAPGLDLVADQQEEFFVHMPRGVV